jgi:hypothetical protein
LLEANKTIKTFDKNVTDNCTLLHNQQVMLAKGIERNTFTIQQYGRMCSEMHTGISANRAEIIKDKAAASTQRLQVAAL